MRPPVPLLQRVSRLVAVVVVSCSASAFSSEPFFDDFDGTELDCTRWRIAKTHFRGEGNSVIPGNLEIGEGLLILRANGDLYEGPLRGINPDGSLRPDGKRTGSAIATEAYLGSGRYEIRMRMATASGVSSGFWTNHYQEFYPGDPEYEPPGDYYAVVHSAELSLVDPFKAMLRTTLGERKGELSRRRGILAQPQDDGQFHHYRFDWHTGGDGQTPCVRFFIDGVYLRTIYTTIPIHQGRLWLGAWINAVAGAPDFETTEMHIDWVQFTPFNESGDEEVAETFPNAGWHLVEPQTDEFFDDFIDPQIDPCRWKVAHKQWGGVDINGGVIPENVQLCDGLLVLRANGDHYEGPLRGVNKDGTPRDDGKRTGAALVTHHYYSSGSYEVRMKVLPAFGAASALWTFWYEESYTPTLEIANHEIDIEIPGRPGPPHNNISFEWALLNTWTGVHGSEATIVYHDLGAPQDDGEFHTYRFDWHTGDETQARRVDFYVDGAFRHSTTTTVPTRAGRFWLGVWFPKNWAGTPDFDTGRMLVDWVRITPFSETNDEWVEETYPYDGWADLGSYPAATDDRDGDGITDGCDDCPDSEPGDPVDETGCSVMSCNASDGL